LGSILNKSQNKEDSLYPKIKSNSFTKTPPLVVPFLKLIFYLKTIDWLASKNSNKTLYPPESDTVKAY
jgi:hypothetical protein